MSDDIAGVYFQSLPTWYTPHVMSSEYQCVEAGQPLTIEWNEQNTGGRDVSYGDDVTLDNSVVGSVSLYLASGTTDARTFTIEQGGSAGEHEVVIVINAGDAVAEGYTRQTVRLCAQQT